MIRPLPAPTFGHAAEAFLPWDPGWRPPPPDMWAAGLDGLAGSGDELPGVLDRVPTGRLVALTAGLAGTALGGLLGIIATTLMRQTALGFAGGAVLGLVTGVAGTAWGRFQAARAWLGLTGHLPWRLVSFLAYAHAAGVLRQNGSVHQFRHASTSSGTHCSKTIFARQADPAACAQPNQAFQHRPGPSLPGRDANRCFCAE